jgi:hypothetical protein
MNEKSIIETLQDEIANSSSDIKAEAQLALALEKGLQTDDFMISCDKRFTREYSKDVVSADLKEIAGMQNILNIHLSRSGIYDLLPEGLFFQTPKRSSKNFLVSDMASDYKVNKKKEENIRRFFMPFEHDFFLQRLGIEKQEMLLLEGLQSGILNEYFMKFWDLPSTIPKIFIAPLLLLLPYAHKIAGNLEVTAQCLELLLGENVEVKKIYNLITDAGAIKRPVIGEALLGQDMVCGENFWNGDPAIEIEIGPLENSGIVPYLDGGNRSILMETFIRFFIPAGADTKITLQVATSSKGMALVKTGGPILGYSSVLG